MPPPSFPFEIEGVFDVLALVDLNLGLIHVAIVAFGLVYTDFLEVIVNRFGNWLGYDGILLLVVYLPAIACELIDVRVLIGQGREL